MRKEDQWNRQGEHAITENGSCSIESYKLAITNQDTERRNFPGYKTHTLTEAMNKEISEEGTTHSRKSNGKKKD